MLVSPATADKLKAKNQPAWTGGEHGQIISDVVELRYKGRTIRGAVFPVVGHPDDCVTVHLGYGRTRAGQTGTGTGFNANAIRTSGRPVARRRRRGGQHRRAVLARVHAVPPSDGRPRHGARGDARRVRPRIRKSVHEAAGGNPEDDAAANDHALPPSFSTKATSGGMAIDVNACIGCNACVVGCQAENNIPVVGKDEVLQRPRDALDPHRHVLPRRAPSIPRPIFQPVPCMQCENAPCEPVCPVGATVHSDEGLNDMVYNRCVGTRYCSNNCPYKVRRFNYFLYQDWNTPSLKLGAQSRRHRAQPRRDGEVHVLRAADQRARRSTRRSRIAASSDGEIQTGVSAGVPADAIVFGDLNDPNEPRHQAEGARRANYSLLGELNTRPRTTYLAAVRNVNPELGE